MSNTTKIVNNELGWMVENRSRLKRWSKQYRKKHPLAKTTHRFEHKLNHRIECLFNAIHYPATHSGNVYISTLNNLKKRFQSFCGIKSLTNKTFKRYLTMLVACKVIKMTRKRGIYTMIVKAGLKYIGAKILGLFRGWGQTFPLSHTFRVYVPYLYLNKDRRTSVIYARSHEPPTFTDVFMTPYQEQVLTMAQELEKSMYWPDSRRKVGINSFRKDQGMTPIPQDTPLRAPKEHQEHAKYDPNANRPSVPMWSPAPPKEVTPEIMTYGINKLDGIRKLLGMGAYKE